MADEREEQKVRVNCVLTCLITVFLFHLQCVFEPIMKFNQSRKYKFSSTACFPLYHHSSLFFLKCLITVCAGPASTVAVMDFNRVSSKGCTTDKRFRQGNGFCKYRAHQTFLPFRHSWVDSLEANRLFAFQGKLHFAREFSPQVSEYCEALLTSLINYVQPKMQFCFFYHDFTMFNKQWRKFPCTVQLPLQSKCICLSLINPSVSS